jgi:hypothetical protein
VSARRPSAFWQTYDCSGLEWDDLREYVLSAAASRGLTAQDLVYGAGKAGLDISSTQNEINIRWRAPKVEVALVKERGIAADRSDRAMFMAISESFQDCRLERSEG